MRWRYTIRHGTARYIAYFLVLYKVKRAKCTQGRYNGTGYRVGTGHTVNRKSTKCDAAQRGTRRIRRTGRDEVQNTVTGPQGVTQHNIQGKKHVVQYYNGHEAQYSKHKSREYSLWLCAVSECGGGSMGDG